MSDGGGAEVDRVEKNKARKLAFGLGVIAFIVLVVARITDGTIFWSVVGGATIVGYAVGRSIKQRWCSACDERLTYDDTICPGCRGRIRGNVTG